MTLPTPIAVLKSPRPIDESNLEDGSEPFDLLDRESKVE